jgi:hypothetical protein
MALETFQRHFFFWQNFLGLTLSNLHPKELADNLTKRLINSFLTIVLLAP